MIGIDTGNTAWVLIAAAMVFFRVIGQKVLLLMPMELVKY